MKLLQAVRSKKVLVSLGLAGAMVLSLGAGAYALTTTIGGSFSERQVFARNDTATLIPVAASAPGAVATWQAVPGMATSVAVPAGTTRLVDARFTAESQCTGGAANSWCSVRIVAISATGAIIELSPQSGSDFAFDANSTDNWESHAMERTSPTFLGAGTYRIVVQAARITSGTAPSFRLDDMHLATELIRP